MKQPDWLRHRAAVIAAAAAIAGFHTTVTAAQELPGDLSANWYRTEVLVFVREDRDSLTAQQFDPLPTPAYPPVYRYFIDPEIADRRLAESRAFASRIDAEGRQYLVVPAPIEELLEHNRPDALIAEPAALLPELEAVPGPGQPGTVADPNAALAAVEPDSGPRAPDANEPLTESEELAPDPNAPVLALPYELLSPQRLSFTEQARSLRRQGHRVLFHESWWTELEEGDEPEWLLLDQSGDIDSLDWPALQGALRVYRSRYLHAEVDLWLNTMGDYLPEGWRIPAPPLAQSSLLSETLAGETVNPWRPAVPPPAATLSARSSAALPGAVTVPESGAPQPPGAFPELGAAPDPNTPPDPNASDPEPDPTADYPWRHAIVHQQSRRMRSGEIHYLDHPVIGVIVRVTPADAEDLPVIGPEALGFRERHGLPIERLQLQPLTDAES